MDSYWIIHWLYYILLGQKKRDEQMSKKKQMTKKGAIIYGLFFGIFMLFFHVIGDPLISKTEITYDKLPIQIPVWILSGLAYGFLVRYFNNRSSKEK